MNYKNNMNVNMSSYYFLVFFSFGSLFPLLSVYLRDSVGLSGGEVGTIMSVGPVVMIFAQPFWGMVSDYTRKPREILSVAIIFTGLMGLLYTMFATYYIFIVIAGLVALFQAAIVPISDSLTLNYVHKTGGDYGKIRLWGAAGFALAVLTMGSLSDILGLKIIFFSFALTLWICAFFSRKMPKESNMMKVSLRSGMRTMFKDKKFVIFLFAAFFLFGPISANNVYFGILLQDVGGSLTGVGIAFLFAAGSEVPFMRWAGSWIKKLGLLKIIFLAAVVSIFRWLFYSFEPTPFLIYITTVAHGFSVGLIIPAALQYVRSIAPEDTKITALSLFASFGQGFGAWFCTFVSGFLLEYYTVFSVYLFFAGLSTAGTIFVGYLLVQDNKEKLKKPLEV